MRARLKRALWLTTALAISILVQQVESDGRAKYLRTLPGYYYVTDVLDGDTIEVDMNGSRETVRLIGIDTPETHDPRKPVQCFGQAAAAQAQKLMGAKPVRLVADAQQNNRDKYNRLLRYVYLEDGRLVNAEMIELGYAFAYTVFPYERLEEFRELERKARAQNKGLWSGCEVDDTRQIKQTQPEA